MPCASANLASSNNPVLGSSQIQTLPDPNPTVDTHFIIMHSMTTRAAFMSIAQILQLSCLQDTGFNIIALPGNLPPHIAPTLQQQLVPHKPYVDMLPWPSLRDRMLISSVAINEAEFVTDLYSLRVWGSIPWEPAGWEIRPEFARKWWFLMDDSIISTTNFWRGQRGEEPLVVSSLSI